MRLYAIDTGYGWTKYCYADVVNGTLAVKTGKFPTAFATLNDAVRLDDHVPHHVHNGLRVLCGEDAVRSSSGFTVRDVESMLRYLPVVVAEVLRRTQVRGGEDVELALGLPPGDFRVFRDRVRDAVREVVVLGQGVVRPTRVEVYPQGAVAKVEVDMDGGFQNGLLVDVGHNTTDVIAVVDGRVLPNDVMTLSGGGLAKVTGEFAGFARFTYGITFATPQEAYDFMRRGHFFNFGQRVEFNGEVSRIVRGYTEWLLAKIRDRWEERLRMAEAMVLFGGGAQLLVDYAPEQLRGMIRVLPEPEFTNARGYMLLVAKRHGVIVDFVSGR